MQQPHIVHIFIKAAALRYPAHKLHNLRPRRKTVRFRDQNRDTQAR